MRKKALVFFINILYKKLAMAKKLPAKSRSRGKGGRYERLVFAGIVIALVAIALVLWGPLRAYRTGGEKKHAPQEKKLEPAPAKQAVPEKTKRPGKKEKAEQKAANKREEIPVLKPAGKTALVAIVIDDLGQDVRSAQEVLSLPARITFAVMPGLAQSRKAAELARQNGREVLIHLPMEPKNKTMKASPGTLRSDMTPMDFLATISDDLIAIPSAVGVNNHEGSSLTENKEAMKFLMAELKARGLFFLDSLTSPKSVAYATAREFGLKAAKRDVFLDNESDNASYVRKQLEELGRLAKERGAAIGIGHPHPVTITELRKWLPEADKQGIAIVPVSRLIQ